MTEQKLEPLAPCDAYEWYLEDKEQEYSTNTIYAHKSRLGHFVRWCDETGLDNLNNMTGRKVERYKTWRRRDGGLNIVSMRTQTSTLKVFLRWCAQRDAVYHHVAENIEVPQVSKREKKRTKEADPERILDTLEYLQKYEYGSNVHVALTLMWTSAMRLGGIRALDVDDYYPRKGYLKVKHRPDTGTPLKNQKSGERPVLLDTSVCDLLDDYIEISRKETTDDFDREPLISTQYGRAATSTMRNWVYKYTQPCRVGKPCPSGEDPERCEYRQEHSKCPECPHNYHPHALRGASITFHRNRGWAIDDLSVRVDASAEVISHHYDEPTDEELLDRQRKFLQN